MSELLTTQNTRCYQCLTPYYTSLISLYRGGQFQSNEEGMFVRLFHLETYNSQELSFRLASYRDFSWPHAIGINGYQDRVNKSEKMRTAQNPIKQVNRCRTTV